MVYTLIAGTACPSEPPVYDIPRLEAITIDGKSDDWGDEGFRADVMSQRSFEGVTPTDFDPRCRLGWTDQGLAVLFVVRDDVPLEKERPLELWMWDGVLLTITPARDLGRETEVKVAAGADPQRPGQKVSFPTLKTGDTTPTLIIASSVMDKAYVVEILYPWANLSRPLKEGDVLSVRAVAEDVDDPDLSMWFGGKAGRLDCKARLASKPSPPIRAVGAGSYERMRDTNVTLWGVGELAGKEVRLLDGEREIASGTMRAAGTRSTATFTVPMPPVGETWADFKAVVDRNIDAPIAIQDAREVRGQAFTEQEIEFDPGYAFSGANFPKADFLDSFEAEALIGPYTVKTTFYDKDFNAVTSAEQVGRYGAMIEIQPEKGRLTRRFRTVVRVPAGVSWWDLGVKASLSLPDSMGPALPEGSLLSEQAEELSGAEAGRGFWTRSFGGVLLAAILESREWAVEDRSSYDARAADRQWWVTFKRQFYGTDKMFSKAFECPAKGMEPTAPVVSEGTLDQAGMTAQGIADIDALLQRWATDSDQAFAVCIVRHGVIALHKAYGERDGKPMTVTTPSWMASITKLMSASLMMMLVDQDLVDMDAPIRDYFPIMRDIPIEKPITVRNLYTHTGGLWGHWGDDMNDMEEVVADYYPYLHADIQSPYNGAGNSLGSKIIETITGEALPQFYRKHLLDPLDCEHTTVYDSSGGTASVPLDMAKIGQMLLSRGAYGDMRFYRRETLQRMFPAPLTKQFGEGTTKVGGFGMQWMAGTPKFSEHTMTHGAASSATFCIDFDHDMVVVMCRNSAGKNFDKYHRQFVSAILNALVEDE